MKFLLLLLIPVFLFSKQSTSYPDTLYLKTNHIYPCSVTDINDDFLKVKYENDVNSSVALRVLDRVYVGELGNVYYDSISFVLELDSLKRFISLRNQQKKYVSQTNKKQIGEKLSQGNEQLNNDFVLSQDTSAFYPVLSLRYGSSDLISASKFLSAYNNPDAYVRPSFYTESEWQRFEPFESQNTFSFDLGVLISNGISAGITYESNNQNKTDKFSYLGFVGNDNNNNPIYFDFDESYQFKAKITSILAYINYRFLQNYTVYPELGLGLGMGLTEFKWSWNIYGEYLTNNTLYYIKDSRVWFEEEEKKFVIQPKVRINFNVSKLTESLSNYIDALYLQFDYTLCSSNYDLMKNLREEVLAQVSIDDLPPSFKRTLFDKYDVDWSGFQIKFGFLFKTSN